MCAATAVTEQDKRSRERGAASRIVGNLADATVTADQIRARLLRAPVSGLEEVIAITKTGGLCRSSRSVGLNMATEFNFWVFPNSYG